MINEDASMMHQHEQQQLPQYPTQQELLQQHLQRQQQMHQGPISPMHRMSLARSNDEEEELETLHNPISARNSVSHNRASAGHKRNISSSYRIGHERKISNPISVYQSPRHQARPRDTFGDVAQVSDLPMHGQAGCQLRRIGSDTSETLKPLSWTSSSTLAPSEKERPKLHTTDGKDAAKKTESDKATVAKRKRKVSKPSVLALFGTLSRKEQLLQLLPAVLLSMVRGAATPLMTKIVGATFSALTDFSATAPPVTNADRHRLMERIKVVSLEFVGLGLATIFIGSVMMTLWVYIGETVAMRLRERLFYAVRGKPMEWFDKGMGADSDKGGDGGAAGLMAKFSRNTDDVRVATSQQVGQVIQNVTTCIACLAVAFASSWALTLVTIASVPIAFVLTTITMQLGRPLVLREHAAVEAASNQVERTIRAISTVKAFNAQPEELARFKKLSSASGTNYMKSCAVWATRLGLTSTITLASFVQGFWYGSYLVQSEKLPAGSAITVFFAALSATQKVQAILRNVTLIDKGQICYSSLAGILHEPGSPQHPSSPSSPTRGKMSAVRPMRKIVPSAACQGEVHLRRIRFAYPSRPDSLVLRDVDMFFPAGETTYIVGGSGSGKSTIAQLLLRQYPTDIGFIEVDGHDAAFIDHDWTRKHIAAVSQSPIVFDMTIRENLAIGSVGSGDATLQQRHVDLTRVSDEEIQAACRIALLHEFVRDLPHGLDTKVGADGASLSGGQKQRLALARMVIRNPSILILDEAVSALDPTTRLLVHEALLQWRKGRSTIVITHDMSQVGPNDFVYVMDQGIVIQQGFRRDLDEAAGAFTEMAQLARDGTSSVNLEASPTGLEFDARKSMKAVRRSSGDGNLVKALKRLSMKNPPLSPTSPTTPDLPPMPSLGSHPLDPRIGKHRSTDAGGLLDMAGTAASKRRPVNAKEFRRPANLQLDDSHKVKLDQPEAPLAAANPSAVAMVGYALATVPNRALLLLGIAIASVCGFVTPAFSIVLGKLMATMGTPTDKKVVLLYSMVVLGLAIADGALLFLRYFVLELAADRWIQKLRAVAYGKILRQERGWFDVADNDAPKICQSIAKDGEDARRLIGQVLGNLWSAFVLLFSGLACALVFGWQLTLLGLGFCILIIGALCVQMALLNNAEEINKRRRETVAKRFYSLAANMRSIRSMSIEPVFCEHFDIALRDSWRAGLRTAPLYGLGSGISEGLIYMSEAAFYALGAYLLSKGIYDLSRVTIVLNLIMFSCSFAMSGAAFLPGLAAAIHAIWDLKRLLDLDVHGEETKGDGRYNIVGNVSFHGVRFAYPTRPTEPVLKGLSLSIAAGECVAVVGGSGCGKSTVAALLQRLYEPKAGSVSIDGHQLSAFDTVYLREHIAVVSQHPDLYDATIAENIAYGGNRARASAHGTSPSLATKGDIELAAQAANADDFVRSLSKGYETPLGNNASLISGGQAQRLAIARALVRRRAKILILDECTSALDPASQRSIMHTLFDGNGLAAQERRRRGVTIVVITHKTEMMRRCDRVILLQDGVVAETGTYDELIRRKGNFASLASGGEWAG